MAFLPPEDKVSLSRPLLTKSASIDNPCSDNSSKMDFFICEETISLVMKQISSKLLIGNENITPHRSNQQACSNLVHK